MDLCFSHDGLSYGNDNSIMGKISNMGTLHFDYRLILYTCWTYFFTNMDLFFSYYQLILIPLWPVLWDYKVPIFEVPIMGTFTNSDVASDLR